MRSATHDLLFGVTYANSSSGQMSAQLQGNVVGTPVNVYRWNPSSVPEPDVGPYQQSQQNDISQKGVYASAASSSRNPSRSCSAGG